MKFKNERLENATEYYIMHGCNAQGVMGSGVAKSLRDKFPLIYNYYRKIQEIYGLKLGNIIPVKRYDKCIINAITQEFYGRDGKKYASYDAIVECIEKLLTYEPIKNRMDKVSIAIPKIGCGLGGLNWQVVSSIFRSYEDGTIEFVVYEVWDE